MESDNEKMIYSIDVGVTPDDVDAYMKRIIREMKKQPMVNTIIEKNMIEAKITKKTKDKAFILWEKDGEFGNIKIEYNGTGGFNVDSEYIGIDKFLNIMRNVQDV